MFAPVDMSLCAIPLLSPLLLLLLLVCCAPCCFLQPLYKNASSLNKVTHDVRHFVNSPVQLSTLTLRFTTCLNVLFFALIYNTFHLIAFFSSPSCNSSSITRLLLFYISFLNSSFHSPSHFSPGTRFLSFLLFISLN